MTKEEKIKVLEQIVKQEGYCGGINCDDCKEVFEIKDNCCPEGTTDDDRHMKRVVRAKRELMRLEEQSLSIKEEEPILLNQYS